MSEPHPCQQLTQMITGCRSSRPVYVAPKLRPLYRVLRALAGLGIFAQESDGACYKSLPAK